LGLVCLSLIPFCAATWIDDCGDDFPYGLALSVTWLVGCLCFNLYRRARVRAQIPAAPKPEWEREPAPLAGARPESEIRIAAIGAGDPAQSKPAPLPLPAPRRLLPRPILNALQTLGLSDTTTHWVQIQKAYRVLAKQCHPDLNPDVTIVGTKFIEIDRAYRLLHAARNRYFP
jgi:hypothetical protein